MGSSSSKPFPANCMKLDRYKDKKEKCVLWDVSFSSRGDIAVSSYNKKWRTFIDLYHRNDFQTNHDAYYSKEYDRYSKEFEPLRYVSFLGTSTDYIVTSLADGIEIIDVENKRVWRSRKLDSQTSCLAVTERQIYVGGYLEISLIILNYELQEVQKFVLENFLLLHIKDMTILDDKIFACTECQSGSNDGAFSCGRTFPFILTTYKKRYSTLYFFLAGLASSIFIMSLSRSITASEKLGLVAVAWQRNEVAFLPFR